MSRHLREGPAPVGPQMSTSPQEPLKDEDIEKLDQYVTREPGK